ARGQLACVHGAAIVAARGHRAVSIAAALHVGDDTSAVGTARPVAVDLDLLAVAVVALALELPAPVLALRLALVVRGAPVAVGGGLVALHGLHPAVAADVIGLVRVAAGAGRALGVLVDVDLVARL